MARTFRIVSLDLSLRATGYASNEGDLGTLTPSARSGGMERLDWIVDGIDDLTRYADLVVIEGYAMQARGSSVFGLGELGGAVRLWLYRHGVPFVDVTPASLKKYATGKGNASKELVLVEAVKRLGYEGADHNEADALWLLNMALWHYEVGSPPKMPAVNLTGLRKVDWPVIDLEEVA